MPFCFMPVPPFQDLPFILPFPQSDAPSQPLRRLPWAELSFPFGQ